MPLRALGTGGPCRHTPAGAQSGGAAAGLHLGRLGGPAVRGAVRNQSYTKTSSILAYCSELRNIFRVTPTDCRLMTWGAVQPRHGRDPFVPAAVEPPPRWLGPALQPAAKRPAHQAPRARVLIRAVWAPAPPVSGPPVPQRALGKGFLAVVPADQRSAARAAADPRAARWCTHIQARPSRLFDARNTLSLEQSLVPGQRAREWARLPWLQLRV